MTTLHPLAKSVPHPAPLRHAAPYWLVNAGLFAAPAAWSAQLIASYGLVGDRCGVGLLQSGGPVDHVDITVAAVGVLAVVIGLAGWIAAYRVWQITRNEAPGDQHQALTAGAGRTRFLGLCGMIASTIFVAATLFALLVPYLVTPCSAPFS
ncbi:MAG: hypothetical protein ABI832_11460 [bacterium]